MPVETAQLKLDLKPTRFQLIAKIIMIFWNILAL